MKRLIKKLKQSHLVITGLAIFISHLFLSLRYSPCISKPLRTFLFKPVLFGPYGIFSAELTIVLGLLIVLLAAFIVIFRKTTNKFSFLGISGFFILLILIAFIINPISGTPLHANICPL
ncbi:hypothetical protein CO166_02700 [Candidatus Roizmanbacteria bacterium CG_4_9_14_3_um_filter_36_11]|nr:MAG: hypothetical protein CO166_02700 [Candidatus Roizmanbacteria bacterium CG_4_9_14_3_um_filter_36_11]